MAKDPTFDPEHTPQTFVDPDLLKIVPPIVRGQISLIVDFDRTTMGRYSAMDHRTIRLGYERAQARMVGGKVHQFQQLLASKKFNPWIPVDPTYRVADIHKVHKKARKAVRAYNDQGFPMRFRDDLDLFVNQFDFSVEQPPDMVVPRAVGGGAGGTATHTCVHWVFRDGVWVEVYNYSLAPDEPTEPRALASSIEDDPLDYNAMDELLPNSGLKAVYQLVVTLERPFPLQDRV